MQHRIQDHPVVLLVDLMKQAVNTLELVHRVQRQRVQTQIKPAPAHIEAKDKSDTHLHQHRITIATDNRI